MPLAALLTSFSALQRAEIAEIGEQRAPQAHDPPRFSALQRAEIAEIATWALGLPLGAPVSVLFNEPKLLKSEWYGGPGHGIACFSALQRAEIAEISALLPHLTQVVAGFSALQRAEIAEMRRLSTSAASVLCVSVLFNEPKLLKLIVSLNLRRICILCFSALQRAEIAEIQRALAPTRGELAFQCSSTSRNC